MRRIARRLFALRAVGRWAGFGATLALALGTAGLWHRSGAIEDYWTSPRVSVTSRESQLSVVLLSQRLPPNPKHPYGYRSRPFAPLPPNMKLVRPTDGSLARVEWSRRDGGGGLRITEVRWPHAYLFATATVVAVITSGLPSCALGRIRRRMRPGPSGAFPVVEPAPPYPRAPQSKSDAAAAPPG